MIESRAMTRRTSSHRAGCASRTSDPVVVNGPAKPSRVPGRKARKQSCRPTTGAPDTGSGEDDAGADDAEADLAGPSDGKEKRRISINTAGGAKQVAGDDRRRIA